MSTALSLAEVNAVIGACGCCEHPRCCPPEKECRSVGFILTQVGFVKPDSTPSDDSEEPPDYQQTKYLVLRHSVSGSDEPPAIGEYPGTEIEYTSFTRSQNWVFSDVQTWDRAFNANLCSLSLPDAVVTPSCTFTGGIVDRYYSPYYDGGTDTWNNFKSTEQEWVYSDGEGDETEAHIAWREQYTDAETWQTMRDEWEIAHPIHVAWEATRDAHDAWEYIRDEHDLWEADPEGYGDEPPLEGPEPPLEGEEPPNPEEPSPEPEEFYGPCTLKTVVITTNWERIGGEVVLADLGEGFPNPNTSDPFYGSVIVTGDDYSYESPVTWAEFKAQAEAWVNDNAAEAFERMDMNASDSDYCPPQGSCLAEKYHTNDVGSPWLAAVTGRMFQYRYKLNKCCGYKRILSGWQEVFWPLIYLEWLAEIALLGSDDPVPPPPVNLDSLAVKKQWLWEGVPPLCPPVDSSESDDPALTPFDHEPMWSPWSAIVKVADGEQGRIGIRNYFQICYGTLRDVMPQVLGEADLSDDEPDTP